MRIAPWIAAVLVLAAVQASAGTIYFDENRGQAGIAVPAVTDAQVDITFRLDRISIDDVDVDGSVFQQVSMPGMALPNNEGAPNLPGFGRLIALPNGAVPRLEIVSMKTETFQGIDVLPAPDIPLDTDDAPLTFVKDEAIYTRDAFYPESPVRLSDTRSLRGVNTVVLGITPFQYNPVARELVVYTELDVRVRFEGGTGEFGEDRLRNPYWEPILAANLINYESLPEASFRAPNTRDTDYEYVIICPDDPVYTAWADSIAQFRVDQGIDAGVVTLTETGATSAAIESWIDNAYAGPTPPVAILLLGDYVSNGGTTGITSPIYNSYCVSDNIYGDVDGDYLPEIVMARMTANPSNIETLVRKAIDYERNPPTNPDFYQNPVVACGWQDERWFQVCTEIVYGFLANELGKTPVREYAIYSGTPGTYWSTNPNTYMLEDYFGSGGLGYLPEDSSHLTDWGGNATRINADLNSGAFILQHRDHGSETGWGEPDYGISDFAGLSNDDLTFVFSINCLTGKYDWSSECFAEAFHRMNGGALGLIAASEISYSFVNDTFVFGIYDEMWPDFDPGYPAATRFNEPVGELRPAFANASGKHYLLASNWPYNPEDKEVTYNLFHMHGDAFTRLYSEVPQSLTVSHQGVLPIGASTFNITADEGAIVALTIDGEIVGVAEATGGPMDMAVTPATTPGVAKLTVTKANYYRHVEEIPVIYPVTYTIVPPSVPVNAATPVTVTVWDSEGYPKPDVVITISGWGVPPLSGTTDTNGETTITVTPPYGEDLSVIGRTIGEPYDCLSDVLPVTGGTDFMSADIDASVASIGLYGSLTPYYEGLIEATASNTGFYLKVEGCGVSAEAFSGGGTTASLNVTPTETGTIAAVVAKKGFNIYPEDIAVEVVYGQLAGSVLDEESVPVVGARVKGYPAGSDTTGAEPVFEAVSETLGVYAIEGDLDVGYYDVYVSKFGYLTLTQEVFIQHGANDVDFYLDFAPSGVVSGIVTEVGTGRPLEATIKIYRADNMELYAETTSDSLAGGAYSISLPYFNYTMNVRAYHHIPENRGISVDSPELTEDFTLEITLANILVLSDGVDKEPEDKLAKDGTVLEYWSGVSDDLESATQIAADLVNLGYDVTQETAAASDPATWLTDYDFIVSSSGDNTAPVASQAYRDALEAYVAAGGKLIIEGGEVAYDSESYPGYPSFCTNVLHVADWTHDSSGNLTVYDGTHPVTTFPNIIGPIAFSYANYGDQDASVPSAGAQMVCSWSSYTTDASVIVFDDNPNPLSGQIVFFQFDYLAGEHAGMMALLENAVTYLMTLETPPEGGISGQVCLEGMTDHSGILISTTPGGGSAYTDASGHYVIEDLYDATYTVRATKDGWSTALIEGVTVSGGGMTYGVNAMLYPVTTCEHCESPALAIPDNVPAGVYDTLTFPDDMTIADVEVYIDITHTYIGDLIVEVTSPQGTTVRLHNRSGGSANDIVGWYDSELPVNGPGALSDFAGESTLGDWTLWVSDNAGADIGTLNSWCVQAMGGAPTGVEESEAGVPVAHVLRGASPNPFNPVTVVSYGVSSDTAVRLAVYNVAGRLVRTLVDGDVEAGYHKAVWDGRNDRGEAVGSGVYFCRMEAGGFDGSTKIVLLK